MTIQSTQGFLMKLKAHLLARILELDPAVIAERASVNSLFLKNDRIYEHQLMTIHYTTYDVRRGRDIIHTGKHTAHRDIMGLLVPEEQTETNRFWFAHVLGIYHVNVIYTGEGSSDRFTTSRRLDFLWVRYYSQLGQRSSPRSLDQLKFPPISESESFGFVDPASVLRCCHIIPAFYKGRRRILPAQVPSICRNDRDWNVYYVNRQVPMFFSPELYYTVQV
jgi:hypothetical protein